MAGVKRLQLAAILIYGAMHRSICAAGAAHDMSGKAGEMRPAVPDDKRDTVLTRKIGTLKR